MSLTLVIGGTRSGKSAHAERLALATGAPVRYIATATAEAGDRSMADRIRRHRARRPASWETVEAGDALAGAIDSGYVSLIDGLGVWIAGARHRHRGGSAGLARVLARALDALGEAVQCLSAAAERVDYVVAGHPIALSAHPAPAIEGLRHHGDRDVRRGEADHAINVLDGGPPAWLRQALRSALDGESDRYPNETEARAATAARHGRDPEEVVVTNGAAEALWLLGPALRPRLAACVHPGFTEAEAGLRAHGVPVTRVQRDPDAGLALEPEAVPDAADLVIVGHPASPSGTLDPASAILALRAPGRVVVVDEAFMEMVPGEPGSLAGEQLDDVIVIRSLTKLLAIPGLRAGYALAPLRLAAALAAVRPPWSANALALAALRVAVDHPAETAARAERAAAEGADLAERLAAVAGVRTWPSVTNFCLIEVADGPAVVAAMRAHGIAVRPAASFPGLGPGHIRITARDPQANARLVAALTAAVAGGPTDARAA